MAGHADGMVRPLAQGRPHLVGRPLSEKALINDNPNNKASSPISGRGCFVTFDIFVIYMGEAIVIILLGLTK